MYDRWHEIFERAISDLTRAMPDADARLIATRAKSIANAATDVSRGLPEEPVVHLARIIGHLVAKPDGANTEGKIRFDAQAWVSDNIAAGIAAAIDHNEIERDGDKFVTPMPF